MEIKTELWEHQKDALDFAKDKKSVIFAHEVGTGKSLTGMAWAAQKGAKKVLVVCPSKIIDVWKHQMSVHTENADITPLSKGSVSVRAGLIIADAPVVSKRTSVMVMNYEITYRTDILYALYAWKPNVVIFDEAHRLKGYNSKTTKAMTKLVKELDIPAALLTGTPMHNKPTDIFALARICNPELYHYTDDTGRTVRAGTAWTRFRERYEKLVSLGQRGIYKTIGYQNQDEMMEKFSTIAHHVRSEDVLELPEYHVFSTPVNLKPSTLKAYKDFEKDFVLKTQDGTIVADNVLVHLLRLRELASGVMSYTDAERTVSDYSKVQVVQEMVRDLPDKEPFVVFAWFTASIEALQTAFEKTGRTVGVISGARSEYTKFFNGELDGIIVQLASGSEGIDLTRARYVYYYELPQSLGMWEQSLGRVYRSGQKRKVVYNVLQSVGTVDSLMYRTLVSKGNIVDALMNELVT